MFVKANSLAGTGKEYIKAEIWNKVMYLWTNDGEKVEVGKISVFGDWDGNFQFRLRDPYYINFQVPGDCPNGFNWRKYGSAKEVSCEKLYEILEEMLEADDFLC